MKWLVSLVGAVLVMVALRDLFHTLWHPTRHGGLSRHVMTTLWKLSQRLPLRRRAAGLAGPLAMVTVVAMWAGSVIVGWALIYWLHMPDAFSFAAGLKPAEHGGLVDALYISMVTVTTLGLGDIAPAVPWLRIVAPLEALVGFVLLTATVSWVLEIYPALTRRRALALRLSQLQRNDPSPMQLDSPVGAAILDSLSVDVARVSVDFLQYAESYYFHDGEDHTSLAATVRYAAELAERGSNTQHAEVRLAASVLTTALEDLASILDERFLHRGGSVHDIYRAYAEDHDKNRS
ncbi:MULTISPECIES: potassium channel family protein [Streptomyces]|uniref:Two pore domain potassium channel family protein n=1 Tax=Streptomyces dengpaensis TaxID=2049881 RepID=A0ABM6SM20_9ACTN|nr:MULTISPECIES: potassium channel family protein [Streptomyces]AVH55726.1 two pore domain potassium channel family protein [Streptomyces dengpaensis]PIB11985.1 Ion transport 2 domain protein [Streptomyces sp. HG99]